MNIALGRSGFKLNAVISLYDSQAESNDQHEVRTELELTDDNAKTYYAQLESLRDQIEAKLGEKLTWYNPENKRTCRIYLRTGADLHDHQQWPAYQEWLRCKLDLLHKRKKVFCNASVKRGRQDCPSSVARTIATVSRARRAGQGEKRSRDLFGKKLS